MRILTAPRGIDLNQEPWILAQKFADRLASALGDMLSDVIVEGSAVLGDWQPKSDIDIVCITERDLDQQAQAAVAALHRNSKGEYGHTIDAMYVTRDSLDRGPDNLPSVVASVTGILYAESTVSPLNWTTWLTLGEYGVRIPFGEGVAPTAFDLKDGGVSLVQKEIAREGAIRFSRANLGEYWPQRITQSERMYLRSVSRTAIPHFEIEWLTLSPARLLETVLTGRIVSKSAAGELAAVRFPAFRPHLEKVLSARRQPDLVTAWDRTDLERSLDFARGCVQFGTTA